LAEQLQIAEKHGKKGFALVAQLDKPHILRGIERSQSSLNSKNHEVQA
jgi:hypothetical protein